MDDGAEVTDESVDEETESVELENWPWETVDW